MTQGSKIDSSTKAGGHVAGRDVANVEAGGSVQSVAQGENSQATHGPCGAGTISSKEELLAALISLLGELSTTEDVAVAEKARTLPALLWLTENFVKPVQPPEAPGHVTVLRQASSWIKSRFEGVFDKAVGASVGHWLIDVFQNTPLPT